MSFNFSKMLTPRMFFGLNTKTRKNVCCISNDEILYPVGGVIILHNFKLKSQRYIHLPNPEREISVITVAIKKNYLAAAEKGLEGEKPRIFIYDLENLKRITTLGIPFEIDTQEFSSITFTHDSHHIAALTAGPDFFMYYYNWKSGKIESQAKANNPPSVPGPVTDMAINPKDATIVVFVGISLFRLLSMSENVWRQYGFQKAQSFSILSVCWLTDDRVLAGCKDGKVMVVQSGDLNGVYDMDEVTEINIIVTSESKKDQLKTLQKSLSKQMSSKQLDTKKHIAGIRCCTAITTGFLYSQKSGEVVYFQKTSKTNYKKCRTFVIKKDVLCQEADYESLYFVNSICTNIDGTLLMCTTNRSQIYWIPLQENEADVVEFNVFEESLHHGPIIGLSTCLWKPIFMTCGDFDNSVRIWNHATMKIVLNQTFMETVNCISLHPTGLYALIGFSDQVRFFLVLIHELQVYREFGVTDCKILAFSNNGHLFAAESNNDILVYSSITFHSVSRFQGHCQRITSLQWSRNDLILHSSSSNGAIYEWSIEKNTRISDVVLPDTVVTGLVALQKEQIICIDNDGNLKEIKNAKVIGSKKLNHKNGECLDFITALENSKCKLLLAGKNGVIISLRYPIEDEPNLDFFLMHNRKITQCCVVDRGRSFISTDIDGTICVWHITDGSIDQQPTNEKYFDEILVNTDELAEKNLNLNHLSCRIAEVKSEHSYEITRQDNFYSNKIKQLEEKYTDEIKFLKKRIKTLEKEHSMELNRIHLDITQMKQLHTSQMDQMDSNFNSKLLYEFQNYDKLKDEMRTMRDTYEKKIKEILSAKNTEDEMHKLQHQREINDLQQQLIQVQNTLAEERKQNAESISSLKNRLADETATLRASYESKLEAECKKLSDLKTELGIAKKKSNMMLKEKEEFKSIKTAYDNEYETMKQKYNDAMSVIGRLKKEIIEKEKHLDAEKKIHSETKRKIKDTMSGQTELECKINALEMQLEEQRNQMEAKEEEIYKLQKKVRKEERGKARFKTHIQQLEGKLRSKDSLLRQCRTKLHDLKVFNSNMQYDVDSLKDLIHEPEKLKRRAKEIYVKYSQKWKTRDSPESKSPQKNVSVAFQ